jgi:hypothetical protein
MRNGLCAANSYVTWESVIVRWNPNSWDSRASDLSNLLGSAPDSRRLGHPSPRLTRCVQWKRSPGCWLLTAFLRLQCYLVVFKLAGSSLATAR